MTNHRHKPDTVIAHGGNNPAANEGIVNPPVYHASTVLHDSVEQFTANHAKRNKPGTTYYGRFGTPTSYALEQAVAELEGGYHAICMPSGLSAITIALMSALKTGDHLLITDSVYDPVRSFCNDILINLGIEVTYYDPLAGAEVEKLVKPNTRVIYLESPGSMTFEVQDVPAITAVARRLGIVTMIDNTWATPLYFSAFKHGIDISIHAATKYIVGHSDAMLGLIVATKERYASLKQATTHFGQCAGPDDVYLALRGFRTLSARLKQHYTQAMTLIGWLQQRAEVARILYPALPEDPGHAIWRRDFNGASGLFGVVMKDYSQSTVNDMIDRLKLFPIGASWGGYESLIRPVWPGKNRTATTWQAEGPLLRFHAGLEDTDDLIKDLEQAFSVFTEKD